MEYVNANCEVDKKKKNLIKLKDGILINLSIIYIYLNSSCWGRWWWWYWIKRRIGLKGWLIWRG